MRTSRPRSLETGHDGHESAALNVDSSFTETARGYFAYTETRATSSNTGTGRLTLPDAGYRSQFMSRAATGSKSLTNHSRSTARMDTLSAIQC